MNRLKALAKYVSPGPRRPPWVAALSALFLFSGVTGLYVTAVPVADVTSHLSVKWISAGSVLTAAVFWIIGSAVPSRWVHFFIFLGAIGLSFTLATASSPVGIALVTIVYVWVSIYIGRFFTALAARFYLLFICCGMGVGLLVSDVHDSLAFWPILAATLVVTVETMLRLSEQLRRQAVRDPLTGMFNRLGLQEATRAVLSSFRRTGRPVSLAVMDLDGFGAVNNRDGHIAGDRLLIELAECWLGTVRSGDVLARFGGDEFVLLMPDTDLAGARSVLDRLNHCHQIRWSSGLVEFNEGESLPEAIERADRLLYLEKSR